MFLGNERMINKDFLKSVLALLALKPYTDGRITRPLKREFGKQG